MAATTTGPSSSSPPAVVDDGYERTCYDDVEVLRLRPSRQFEPFLSADVAENEDNENPQWEELRRLRTEAEFRNYAREKFDTVKVPSDPTRNLTFHGFLRRKWAGQKADDGGGVAHQGESALRRRRRLSHAYITSLKLEGGRLQETAETDNRRAGSKRRASAPPPVPEPDSKRVRFDDFEFEMKDVLRRFKLRPMLDEANRSRKVSYRNGGTLSAHRQFEYYVRHYKMGMEESRNFLQYYGDSAASSSAPAAAGAGDDNNNYSGNFGPTLPDSLSKEVVDTEAVYRRFVDVYGPNDVVHCKDCSAMDRERVMHPY